MAINTSNLKTLNEWLEYIESLHQLEIEFGLKRVKQVFDILFSEGLKGKVIIVGGTNGKGTSCTYLENILLAAGYSCGKNTSPHIHLFNERISINGVNALDQDIICAFQKVENARRNILLTYFEYTFLAALVVFENKGVDYLICEVGMGGRLDAVNILSPEVSIITSIGIDHIQWLGDSREKIAMEKVAIARSQKPCIIGDVDLPDKASHYLEHHNVSSYLNGKDFSIDVTENGSWQIRCKSLMNNGFTNLPPLSAPHLYENACCAILALSLLDNVFITPEHIHEGLQKMMIEGRCQIISENPLVIVDVAHNVDSIKALSNFIRCQAISGRVVAVCSMLNDKDISGGLAEIHEQIDEWFIAPLESPRAAQLGDIQGAIRSLSQSVSINCVNSVQNAYFEAKKSITKNDCMVVFGSFFVVGDILRNH